MSFCFVHAADLHLDTPFEGLALRDEALRDRLVDASLQALDALVDLAVRERALFVALAGDVYDGATRGLRAQARMLEATRRLDGAGIWTFVAHGNHDPVGEGWTAVRDWPERVRIFPADRAETVHLVAEDGTPVTVTGTSFPTREVTTGLHARFPHAEGAGFHVAVLHANVGSVAEHAPYSPCRLEDLVALGYDAWLLGHVHRRQTLREARPFVAYPGNLQGRSFKPSEQGPKGALVVEVDGGEPQARFVELGPVRFEEVVVDVSACADFGAVVDAVVGALGERVAGGRTVLARARITGRTPAYEDLARDDGDGGLLDALRDATAVAAPDVTWVSVAVDVRAPFDLDALRESRDLAGQLVRELDQLKADPMALRRLLAGNPAVRELAGVGQDELLALADRAGDLALHLLGGN